MKEGVLKVDNEEGTYTDAFLDLGKHTMRNDGTGYDKNDYRNGDRSRGFYHGEGPGSLFLSSR